MMNCISVWLLLEPNTSLVKVGLFDGNKGQRKKLFSMFAIDIHALVCCSPAINPCAKEGAVE